MYLYINIALITASAIFTFINWRTYKKEKKMDEDFKRWWDEANK